MPILIVLAVVAHVMTLAAAQDAWEGRAPDFGRAFSVSLGRIPALFIAAILIALLAIVPLLLSFVGIGLLLLLALSFFMMYVTASIVLGGRAAAPRSVSPTAWCAPIPAPARSPSSPSSSSRSSAQIANSIVAHVPLVNLVAAFVIGGFTTAFSAVVSARFYNLLTGREAAPAFAAGPPQPPYPPPGSSIMRG